MTNPVSNIWYDYNNKIWANAVMVSESTRNNYMNAEVGTSINESDILAYFVWIPRYKYQLFNTSYSYNSSPIEIQVEFESISTPKSSGNSNGSWLIHPAFSYEEDGNIVELEGFWVGKFETTGTSGSPTIKPSQQSLRSLKVSEQFSVSQMFSSIIYLNTASNVDPHMMKNMEWGAVSYLKQSKYGLSLTDIKMNSNSSYYTGGGSANTAYINNTAQSTTGNVYGIYDMSGGAYEYVMANQNKRVGSSGLDFSTLKSKYYDLYVGVLISATRLGDALGETQGWYGDTLTLWSSSRPFIIRGGYRGTSAADAGLYFTYSHTGTQDPTVSFRAVLF